MKQNKNKRGRYLGMLLGTLGAISFEDLLTGKYTITAAEGIIRVGAGKLKQARLFNATLSFN